MRFAPSKRRPRPPDPPPRRPPDRGVARAKRIARLLDDIYVDPILGLLAPGAGDIVSSTLGLYLVGIALDRGLPAVVIARMLINLALDTTIGAIPIVGDVFDFFYKANTRNLELLDARHVDRRSRPGDWLFVALAVGACCLAVIVPVWITVRLVTWIF